MRIAVFIPGFQVDDTDWCIPAFTNLTRELAKGAEIVVFALRHPPRRATYWIGDVLVHALGPVGFGPVRIPGVGLARLWARTLRYFDREHSEQPFDAVLASWATESGALGCMAGKRKGIPVVVHLAGGELAWLPEIGYGNYQRGFAGALVEYSFANATSLTIPSTYIYRLLSRTHQEASTKATLWPLGVNTEMFSTEDTHCQQHHSFTFLAVASLLPVKGLETLLAATDILRKERPGFDFRVVIVGEGPLRPRLNARIDRLKLKGYVVLLGDVSHSDLPEIYNAASCFVMTSLHEAQCMALLEAASAGLPWIATAVGAALDMMKSAESSGVLLTDKSPRTLAAAMGFVLDLPPSKLEEMGRSARAHVLLHYDLERQSMRLLNMLESLTVPGLPVRISATTSKSVTRDVLLLMRDTIKFSLRSLVR